MYHFIIWEEECITVNNSIIRLLGFIINLSFIDDYVLNVSL